MKRTLAVILVIAAVLFAAAFGLQGFAHERAMESHQWLLETLLPGSDEFVRIPCEGEEGIRSVHRGQTGYVIETVTRGYADEITIYVAVDPDGKVMGLVTYDAHETPGLGSRILTDHEFLSQFLGKSGGFTVETGSPDAFSGATAQMEGDGASVDAISGATVSSKAVARCVSAATSYVTGADVTSSATEWGG